MKKMKTQITTLAGFFLIFGCTLPINAEQLISLQLERPRGCFLEDAPAPLSIASYTLYQTQVAKSQHLPLLHKPIATWLFLRVVPPQLPAYQMKPLWLLGLLIVILPGIILRTLYKKNV